MKRARLFTKGCQCGLNLLGNQSAPLLFTLLPSYSREKSPKCQLSTEIKMEINSVTASLEKLDSTNLILEFPSKPVL